MVLFHLLTFIQVGIQSDIHIEVLNSSGASFLVLQIAFPEDISNIVYARSDYNGDFDTKNRKDGKFKDSLDRNMATITGNITDGYILTKVVKFV